MSNVISTLIYSDSVKSDLAGSQQDGLRRGAELAVDDTSLPGTLWPAPRN
jgi:hypothetical protein